MLNSRYLYLHEALDLGPMWLKQGAHLTDRPSETPALPAADRAAAPPDAPRPAADSQARAALLAALHHRQPDKPAIPDTPKTTAGTSFQTASSPSFADTPIQAADLMIISLCPSLEDSVAGQLFSGTPGQLLDNMLAAIGLTRQQTHTTSWLAAPVFTPPTPEIMAAEHARLADAARRSQARAVLFLGESFTQPEQQADIQVVCAKLPLFHIPHPAQLLRRPQLKAQAWQELKKLRRLLSGTASPP